MRRHTGLSLTVGLLILAGCAATQYDQGKKMLKQEDYAGAVEMLETALRKEPKNPDILVDLAEALYHQDELGEAEGYLEQARSLDPGNTEAILLVGLVHEKRGDQDAADVHKPIPEEEGRA